MKFGLVIFHDPCTMCLVERFSFVVFLPIQEDFLCVEYQRHLDLQAACFFRPSKRPRGRAPWWIPSLKLTFLHLRMDGWNASELLVSFRECKYLGSKQTEVLQTSFFQVTFSGLFEWRNMSSCEFHHFWPDKDPFDQWDGCLSYTGWEWDSVD